MILRPLSRTSCLFARSYATSTTSTSSAPPMLLKLRADLKTAMRAKDTQRLSVLRSLLSSTLNASKTSSPINTDMQMLSLIRKTASASRAAKEDFDKNGRTDLAEKEDGQLKIMEEYAAGVETVGEVEVREVVERIVREMKVEINGDLKLGDVLKKIFGNEGLEGRNFEKGDVARVVKEVLAK